MDITKIVRLGAVLFAVVAGIVTIPSEAAIIAVLGLVGGYFVEVDRRLPYMVLALTLSLVHGALSPIPVIGMPVTDILGSVSALINAGACMVIVMQIVDRLKP